MKSLGEELCRIVARSGCRAARQVVSMTDGYTLHDYGLESFLVHEVGVAVRKKFRPYGHPVQIFPELPLAEIWDDADTSRLGRPFDTMRGRPRIDLAIYRNRKPFAVVEFKRGINFSRLSKDIRRVSNLLQKAGKPASGPVRFGVIAGVRAIQENTRKEAADISDEIVEKARVELSDTSFTYVKRQTHLGEPLVWADDPERAPVTGFWSFALLVERPKA